ncbi:acetyl-CoA hydrolase/transferase C-terminal domain-containing protein [Hydrogenophaga sp. BPS33]|uniref:acetyl-CoA hydrolase/transferase C-terminal domain-containing protein n=1 Tax=Hydrogenophaga sp. BPS33 TaxID=2651974 RepID=UPI00131FE3E4|nr:acetyl-CoA hydrolase/transferase C-terminal domain-containing protein [Hydrogenophaga sp. BPS33]QHE84841.1 methyltransferase [Hydrogenophaga sp. BPS33]
MTSSRLAELIRPDDHIAVGQAAGEPVGLIAELFQLAPRLGSVNVFCGLSLNPAWGGDVPDAVRVSTYCGLGTVGKLVARQRARVMPASLPQLSSFIASRKLPVDVVLLQVSPADAGGYHSLGCTLDYVWDAVQVARVVVVEVNANMPMTRGVGRLHSSRVVVARESDDALLESPAEEPTEVQRQVARHVASLVPDGATLQLGIGGLAGAVAGALKQRRDLKIRSGLVGDWYLDLLDSGALDTTPDACLTALVVGSSSLYASLSREGGLGFAPATQLVLPIPGSPLMAINSAIEVDLCGQVNAEFLGERYVGAVGGQTDYFRAARRSESGLAILAMPATTGRGAKSRIVPRCTYVTSAQSDVDVIVTEHGAADIRATTLQERRALIANVAHPQTRGLLLQSGAPQ